MADYNISAEITADASGFESGVKKAQKASKNLSKSISGVIQGLGKSGLVGALGAVGLASSGLSATLGTVVKVARQVSKAINECTEAYKTQLIAERSLDTAIQNNPFVTGASADALKQFASEMQKVSNYGDEELIPMMANLVSLGRTEAETMQIMSVAMDMSAGMGISLDTAITQLNATLNGNIGRLGQQNAELKDLTAEELRQGKAVEILGEKFKGLSSATADTSKQLQNIKGDFKEALGQFTLPSSDLWNKFWAGFYEKGIEAINKINAFMDAQIIGKKLANSITEQIAKINPADVGGRIDYTRNVLKVIGDNELEALKNYLSGLKKLSAEQEYISKLISTEQQAREWVTEEAKKEAEAKKAQADAEAQITVESEKQAEISKKKTDWDSKLLDQRIELLETERDRAIQYAEEEEKESYSIWREYNEKILELKLERLEKEKEKALTEEGLTAEDKIKIEEYYEGETKKIYDELGKYKKKKNEEEVKDEKNKYIEMLKVAGEYTKKLAETFKNVVNKISSTVKNVFSTVENIFTKLFEFDPDKALDNLLKFEDMILTFFVETLPKLPSFFASAIQSIIVLIETVMNLIDFETITNIVDSILKSVLNGITHIAEYLNKNADKITEGLTLLVSTIVQNLADWVESGGWKTLLDALLNLQKGLEKVITDNLPAIVDTIIEMLPDLINFLIESIVSASKALGKMMKPILKLVVKLIEAIIEVAFSDEVIDASFDVIEDFVEALLETIVEMLPKILPKIIAKLLKTILRSKFEFPARIAKSFLSGMIKAFQNTDWLQFVKDCFMGFIDGIKEFFGIHSPSTLFESFGEFMIEGLWNGIKNMGSWLSENMFGFFSNLWEGIQNVFSGVGDWFGNVFKGAKDRITSAFEGIGNWASGVWANIKGGFSNVGSWFSSTFSGASSAIKNAFSGLGDWFNDLWNNIKNGASSVGDAIGGAVSKAGDWVGGVGEGIWDFGKSVGEGIKDAVDDAGDWFEGVVDGVSDWVDSWKFWATGTNVAPKGLAVVGEAGPELVRFNGGEQVLNTRNTQKALEGVGGNTNNFNVTFNNLQDTSAFAMMNQLKQYKRQMAINGVI